MKIKKRIEKKIFCFDLDNTLCVTTGNNYQKSKPLKKKIKIVNKLFEEGHIIKIFTARFMGRSKENIVKAKKRGYSLSKNQLKKWKLKHHILIMGKPSFDYLIDDKSINFDKNWDKKLKSFIKN